MKMLKEHYETYKREIFKLCVEHADKVAAHKEFVRNDDRVQDFEKRWRWELYYGAGLNTSTFDHINYTKRYLTDDNIDTALRKIVKELGVGFYD